MSAVEEWNAVRPEANNIMPRLAKTADAAIAELEAEKAHGAACYSGMEEAKRLVSIERDEARKAEAAWYSVAEVHCGLGATPATLADYIEQAAAEIESLRTVMLQMANAEGE